MTTMSPPREFTEDEERKIALIANAIADKVEAAFAKDDEKPRAPPQPPAPPPPRDA